MGRPVAAIIGSFLLLQPVPTRAHWCPSLSKPSCSAALPRARVEVLAPARAKGIRSHIAAMKAALGGLRELHRTCLAGARSLCRRFAPTGSPGPRSKKGGAGAKAGRHPGSAATGSPTSRHSPAVVLELRTAHSRLRSKWRRAHCRTLVISSIRRCLASARIQRSWARWRSGLARTTAGLAPAGLQRTTAAAKTPASAYGASVRLHDLSVVLTEERRRMVELREDLLSPLRIGQRRSSGRSGSQPGPGFAMDAGGLTQLRRAVRRRFDLEAANLARVAHKVRRNADRGLFMALSRGSLQGDAKADTLFRLGLLNLGRQRSASRRTSRLVAPEKKVPRWRRQAGVRLLAARGKCRIGRRWLLRLVKEHPGFRRLDSALYLLGRCALEDGRRKLAFKLFADLVRRYSASQYSAEAWLLQGRILRAKGRLSDAEKAYSRAARPPWTRASRLALYALATTHYYSDSAKLALPVLWQFLMYQSRTNRAKRTCWNEAVWFIAVAFWRADPKPPVQNRSGSRLLRLRPPCALDHVLNLTRVRRFFTSRRRAPFAREVLLKLATATFRLGERATIPVLKLAIELYPGHPGNVLVEERVGRAAVRHYRFKEAIVQWGRIARLYGPGSRWHRKQSRNRGAQRSIRRVLRRVVKRWAEHLHKLARHHSKNGTKKVARKSYLMAVVAYRKLLVLDPRGRRGYETSYLLADVLRLAGRGAEAARMYRKVRDWPGQRKWRAEAVKALEALRAGAARKK